MRRSVVAVGFAVVVASSTARAEDATEDPVVPVDPPADPPAPTAPAPEPAPAKSKRPIDVALIIGTNIPINGLNYNTGVGLRGGVHFGRIYVGGMFAVHAGDSKTIDYGPVPALGIDDAVQKYDTTPFFLVGDVGYRLPIEAGKLKMALTPYVSTGLLSIITSSSGDYGDTTTVHESFLLGFGASYTFRMKSWYSLGLHYRMYNVGDTEFRFGDSDDGTIEHGFTTSIFYGAFYAELVAHF